MNSREEIQHRLELPGIGETVRAIRATLMTLGQRIPEGNAEDLAASLPMEIKWYLTGAVHEHGQRFDWRDFVSRVGEIERSEPPEAAYHAQVIMGWLPALDGRDVFSQSADDRVGTGFDDYAAATSTVNHSTSVGHITSIS